MVVVCLVTKYATGREKQMVLENESLSLEPRKSDFNRDSRCSLSVRLDSECHIKASRGCYELWKSWPLKTKGRHLEDQSPCKHHHCMWRIPENKRKPQCPKAGLREGHGLMLHERAHG